MRFAMPTSLRDHRHASWPAWRPTVVRAIWFRFYELNVRVAIPQAPNPYFTYIRNSLAKIDIVPGDARLSLERKFSESGSQKFDVLILDAF